MNSCLSQSCFSEMLHFRHVSRVLEKKKGQKIFSWKHQNQMETQGFSDNRVENLVSPCWMKTSSHWQFGGLLLSHSKIFVKKMILFHSTLQNARYNLLLHCYTVWKSSSLTHKCKNNMKSWHVVDRLDACNHSRWRIPWARKLHRFVFSCCGCSLTAQLWKQPRNEACFCFVWLFKEVNLVAGEGQARERMRNLPRRRAEQRAGSSLTYLWTLAQLLPFSYDVVGHHYKGRVALRFWSGKRK